MPAQGDSTAAGTAAGSSTRTSPRSPSKLVPITDAGSLLQSNVPETTANNEGRNLGCPRNISAILANELIPGYLDDII